MSATIRLATKQDLPAILRLYAQPGLDDGEMLPLDEAARLFARIESYPDYHLYVAETGGEVVGTFALLILENLSHLGARSGLVEAVAVSPEQQGQGIGRLMMEHALERCRTAGCYKMALSSNLKREQAHAFYDSLGFERHGYSFRMDLP
ncbi:MAG TPA: GNAT family N-acetyltransferase [Thermoanaerobaculia bacterium]|nr:GNAT family N-acetyltransferase [Thermoanaerobaculia bacterium]